MNKPDPETGLLPCPFCGSKATFGELDSGENFGGQFVECINPQCGVSSPLMFPSKEDPTPPLREAWNKRQPPALLTFDRLSTANLIRCEASFHPIKDWSATDWACALAAEVGILCNLIKKQRRSLDKARVDSNRDQIEKDLMVDEIGDVVAYLDLLATRLGIDLETAVRSKFNKVSARVGSTVTL